MFKKQLLFAGIYDTLYKHLPAVFLSKETTLDENDLYC